MVVFEGSNVKGAEGAAAAFADISFPSSPMSAYTRAPLKSHEKIQHDMGTPATEPMARKLD